MRMERNSPAREKEWKTKGGKKIAALKEAKGSEKPIREPQRHTNYSNQKFDKSEPLPLKKDTVGDTCSYNKDSLQQDRTHKQASGIQKLLRPKAKHTIQKQSDKSPQESTERTVNQEHFRSCRLWRKMANNAFMPEGKFYANHAFVHKGKLYAKAVIVYITTTPLNLA